MHNDAISINGLRPDCIDFLELHASQVDWSAPMHIQFIRLIERDLGKKISQIFRPAKHLRVSVFVHDEFALGSHDFLREFGWIEELDIWHSPNLKTLDFLGHFSQTKILTIGEDAFKPCSFKPVSHMHSLESLHLNTKLSDLEAVGSLRNLKRVILQNNKINDLTFLNQWTGCPMEYLKLWYISKLADLSPINGITSLQELILCDLKKVERIPDFSKLKNLKKLDISDMDGLEDISGLYHIPNLEELSIQGAKKLDPEKLRPLRDHPTLKYATIRFGTMLKANKLAKEILPLPDCPIEE